MKKLIVFTMMLTLIASNIILAQNNVKLVKDELIPKPLPQPKLKFTGKEISQSNGQKWVRFNLRVKNYDLFPDSLFQASPNLPACGANDAASRTWVDIIDSSNGKRLYGFCSLGSSAGLENLWFAVKKGEEPPNCVHIVMTDRKLNKVYQSNKVCLNEGEVPDDITTEPVGQADLKVRQFLFAPTNDKALRVQVANYGNGVAQANVLRLTVRKINGTPVGRVTEIQVPAIGAGKADWVLIYVDQILPKNVALKDTTFKLNIDATKLISESDEANNEAWHNL
jgi:hypothetical protein